MLAPARGENKAGGPLPARLTRTLPFASLQIGAQVASLRSPILRWSTLRISALNLKTRGPTWKSAFDRTFGFANYKVSGFANYSRPVLLAPRHPFSSHDVM